MKFGAIKWGDRRIACCGKKYRSNLVAILSICNVTFQTKVFRQITVWFSIHSNCYEVFIFEVERSIYPLWFLMDVKVTDELFVGFPCGFPTILYVYLSNQMKIGLASHYDFFFFMQFEVVNMLLAYCFNWVFYGKKWKFLCKIATGIVLLRLRSFVWQLICLICFKQFFFSRNNVFNRSAFGTCFGLSPIDSLSSKSLITR